MDRELQPKFAVCPRVISFNALLVLLVNTIATATTLVRLTVMTA